MEREGAGAAYTGLWRRRLSTEINAPHPDSGRKHSLMDPSGLPGSASLSRSLPLIYFISSPLLFFTLARWCHMLFNYPREDCPRQKKENNLFIFLHAEL